jgi:Methyltransferase domain
LTRIVAHSTPGAAGPSPQGSTAVSCENCGRSTQWEPRFEPSASVRRCRACRGWSYVGDVLDAPEALYDEGYFNGREYAAYDIAGASHQSNFRRKLRLLGQNGMAEVAPVRLVEIGCATGEFLAAARRQGIDEAIGVEVSGWCRHVAAGRGFDVLAADDPSLFRRLAEFRPNVIVAWDTWEHLRTPKSTLDEYLSIASPRVLVAMTTVDAGSAVARVRGRRWRQFHPPTHLHYPTRQSLVDYFGDRGFRIRYHRSFGYSRPLLEYVRALGLPAAARPGILATPLYLNLFDIQMIIAMRPSAPRGAT